MNLFELGLYLPGIDAIMKGMVPFKDFFYLRGPFELYPPAFFMQVFGAQTAVLSAYFYATTVLCLILGVVIAREVLAGRVFLYLLVPVLVARTFPRVVFTYWGGMRYAWGLLAVLCAVKFFKTRRWPWLAAAGVMTAIGGLTSVEIGLSAGAAIAAVLIFQACYEQDRALFVRPFGIFCAAVLAVVFPYFLYFYAHGGLYLYLDGVYHVATRMGATFLQTEAVPQNFLEALGALLNPANTNFHQMTPIFCYLAAAGYGWHLWQRRKITPVDMGVAVIAVYALMIYVTGFRNLWASVFEMSLLPEKIVLFFLLERLFFHFRQTGARKALAWVVLGVVAVSSLGYALSHFNKRFYAFKWLTRVVSGKNTSSVLPLADQPVKAVAVERLRGFVVPQQQAMDVEGVVNFLAAHTRSDEPVLMFPELGALHFFADRPWVGRFSMPTLSWIKEGWHREFMADLQDFKPRYAVVNKKVPDYFYASYFSVADNRLRFDEAMKYIETHYRDVAQTPSYRILERQ